MDKCIVTVGKAGKDFRNLARRNNVSLSKLEEITYKYRAMSGNEEAFPTDAFIKAELGQYPYIESKDILPTIKELWQRKYSKALTFNSTREALQAAAKAEKFFPKEAIHVYGNNRGKQVVRVQEPVGRMPIYHRKDFRSWQEYNDYLLAMGDLVPENKRETERDYDKTKGHSESLRRLKPQYRGKLIYAQSGTGKSTIADNIDVIDSDYLLGQVLGVSTETAGFFFKTLSAEQKQAFGKQYRDLIRQKVAEGKTVLTANASMLDDADVVVYNQSAEQTEKRANSADRAINNRYSALDYHQQTLDQIKKLKANEQDKEYIELDDESYLGSHLLSNPTTVDTNRVSEDRRNNMGSLEGGLESRLTQEKLVNDFLDTFGISVNHLDNYNGSLPLFDALNRVFNISDASEITDAMGYAIAFMMQGDKEMQEILAANLGVEGDFNTKLRRIPGIKKRLTLGTISQGLASERDAVIRNVGSRIASELKKAFNAENTDSIINEENKSIWDIIKGFFLKMAAKILVRAPRISNSKKQEKIELFVSDIVEALGREDFSRIKGPQIKPGSKEKAQLVNVEEAFKDNPFEASIIEKLSSKGIALAGSTSIALEGTLLRPSENPLHDIDFATPDNTTKEDLDRILSSIFGKENVAYVSTISKKGIIAQLTGNKEKGQATITYVVFDRPFTTKNIDRYTQEYYDKKGNLIGKRYYKNGVQLDVMNGAQGKLLDFFTGPESESKFGFYKKNIYSKDYLIQSSKGALAAKILWARPKDMWDYKNFKKNQQPDNNALDDVQFSISSPRTFTFNDGVTVTAPFQPNEQQVEALNALSDFINSDETSMTLSGYAGTGKTSLMEMIAAKMKKQHKKIVFSASTNKAAAVLRDRVQKSGFTAQTLNKVFGIQVEVDSTKPYDAANLVNKLKEAEITPGTVVVIDEASMINEENYNILNGIARANDLKIIYTGDKGQLAPVNETQISKVFRDKNGRIVTLTKVERTDDNAILKEATAIRNGKPLSGESSFNSQGKGVAYMRPSNRDGKKAIIEHFVPMLKQNPDYFRILAYTNRAVADYNTAVRNTLGYYDNTPRVGEPIVGYNNWGAEYDRKTKQTTYRFINSESYKVVEVKPAKQVYYSLENGTRVTMTAIPITIEDAMGKREKIDLMDIKGNPQNLQAATILAKEKARLFDKARYAPRKEQPAIYSEINDIEKFLFVNDNIMEGSRKLQTKVFDFGYAMTVHKSQGSTFTHVLMDDTDIATAKNQTAPKGMDFVSQVEAYNAVENHGQPVNLGMDDTVTDMQTTSSGNLLAALPQSSGLNAETINKQADNVASTRQQLEYVAVSRATDTVTIISNNVKSEDTPLNHLPQNTVQSGPATLNPTTVENTPKPVSQMNRKELWEHLESLAEPMGERPIAYTPVGKTRQQYIVKDGKVYNKKGEEVHYQGKDINRILANLAVAEDRGVVVTYRDNDYVVDNHQNITSVTSGDIVFKNENDGNRREILQLAEQKFRTLIKNRQQRLSEMIPELMDLLKALGITIHDRADMEKFLKENPEWATKIQQIINAGSQLSFARDVKKPKGIDKNLLSSAIMTQANTFEHLIDWLKNNIGSVAKRVIFFGNTGYLWSTENGYEFFIEKALDINERNYAELNNWIYTYGTDQKTLDIIRSFEELRDAKERMHRLIEYFRGQGSNEYSRASSQINGLKRLAVTNTTGTNGDNVATSNGQEGFRPVAIKRDDVTGLSFLITSEGEIYGFADKKGDLYFDETVVSPNVQIHEYTHLWDRAVAQRNPRLWKRGIALMKQTSSWNEVLNDPNYGQKWQALDGMTNEKLESLIASEVHSKLVGTQGEALLNRIAKEKGSKGIVGKLKQWILDFWKELKATFSNWSDEEISKLTLDDFNKMTVRDLVDKVNLKEQQDTQQSTQPQTIEDLYENSRVEETNEGIKIPFAIGVSIKTPDSLGGYTFKIDSINDESDMPVRAKSYDRNGNMTHITDMPYEYFETIKGIQVFSPSGEDITNMYRSTINSQNQRYNNNQISYGNDFRRVQEAVRKGSSGTLGKEGIGQDASERLRGLLQRELASQSSFGSLGTRVLTHDKTGTKFIIHEQTSPQLFHDIFEVVRNYTHNGELVDLHDDYSDCKCYLNEDGTCGFAIEPDGNLVSVFNLGVQKGFLSTIAQYAIEQGATHLDAYNSSKQPLKTIYEKTLGAKVASSMDYNMEFDHDNIAANHGNPQVVFMVIGKAAEGRVEEKHFNKDQYDEAQAYQKSFLSASQATMPEVSPSGISVSLPGYENLNSLYENIKVDAEWKIPILQDLDSQLSTENTEEENQQILSQMDRVLRSPSQEEYEKAPTKQKEETNKRMEDYQKRNQQLNSLMENTVGLKPSEVRETAVSIMNILSDIVTEIQQNPEKAKEYWPTLSSKKDISKASRKEIISEIVGINRLIALAKQRFDDLKWSEDPELEALYNHRSLIEQHDLVMNNWDAVMRFAGDVFTMNEGFGIKRNSKKGNYEVEEREYVGYDVDNFSDPQDQDAIAEEEDEQEHWQVEAKTIDVINSMSQLVNMAILGCYELDSNGNKILDKWGIPKRVSKEQAVKKILYWTSGTNSLRDMINHMEAKKERNPWITQLTQRLKDDSGKEADLQSQFYGVMHRHFQLYGIGQLKDGHYVSMIRNRRRALAEITKGINALFQMHHHPLFNRNNTINIENLNALESWYQELEKLETRYRNSDDEISVDDIQDAAKNVTAISRMLGYATTEEAVIPAITKENLNKMVVALRLMLYERGLKAQAQENPEGYKPFEYRAKNSIDGALSKFLQPLTEELEETALNTIFEDGKMYQSYTIPSFLSQLMDSFAQPDENFTSWVESFYGNSQWFKTRDGRWRTPWLAVMMANPEARKVFEHHVMLNFNKHNYMKTMTPEELNLAIITNYFTSKTNEKEPNSTPAWFRVPLQSNKPSLEFIKFYSYRSADYKNDIVNAMQDFFLQELDRIDTVRKRNKQKGDDSFIASWDEYGRRFMSLPFLNGYLVDNGEVVDKEGGKLFRNSDGTVDTAKNNRLKTLLNNKLNAEKELPAAEEEELRKLVREATYTYMQNMADYILQDYDKKGILKAVEKVENIKDYNRSVKENVENFIWNDFFAANNILQLTITDQAFYPSTAELSKRLAELHAPGTKANKYATDYQGNPVSDGFYRTVIINDYEGFVSNIIDNLTEIFNRKIAQAPKAEQAAWIALRDSLVGKDGRYRKINVTDGQAYSSISSYRKKAFMFGKWSKEAEDIYNRLRNGDFNLSDLETVFQPLKPFVYGHVHKNMGVQNASIQEMNVPFQAKNSEYLLIMAEALIAGQETGRPNLLKVISEVMEESERLFPTKGIDTIQFVSAIKSGAQGVVDIGRYTLSPTGEAEARAALTQAMYVRNEKGEIVGYNYDTFVHMTDYDSYALQQEVPKHFQEHMQAEPSQKRANILSDLDRWLNPQGDKNDPANINYYTWKDPDGTVHNLDADEFRKEYENVHAKNIDESFNELARLFHLNSDDRIERNIALSELLQEEIESSPRYGIDLMLACQIDPKTGDFRIPKGDPVQSKRIEQLINSIIKSRINKQKLAGGPIVQVTNWGTSKQLHIRFTDKQGNLLPTREEYEAKVLSASPESKSYKEFIKENQGGIAHFEIFAPASWKKHLEKFRNPDGTINLDAVEKCDPNLLRMITSRIPNEDKYSIAHGKIVGFMPEVAGEVIMFPYDLTEIDDSDFDVDKRYCHVFEFEDIVLDKGKVKDSLYKMLSDNYKKYHDGKDMPYETKKKVNDSIGILMDNTEVFKNTYTDKFSQNLYNAYQHILHTQFPYKVIYPRKDSKQDRNNQILNMDWAVMSNIMTASKILNPGGFEIPKHDAYVIAVYRAKNGQIEWEELDAMTTKQLQKLMPPAGNLCWINVHTQFYKQNAAGSNLIGIFAVNKVAHALLEADDILVDVKDICGEGNEFFEIAGFKFGGYKDYAGRPLMTEKEFEEQKKHDKQLEGVEYEEYVSVKADINQSNRMQVDPSQDSEGNYIGKGLGSMVGASADTAKDPWLDFIGINKTTSAVYNTLLRLGMPQKDAELFMSQDALVSLINDFNHDSLLGTTTLDAVLSKKMSAIASKHGFAEDSVINSEPLTREELKKGLLPNRGLTGDALVEKEKIDYKVLLAFSRLQNLAKALRKPTLVTRLNSISSAVGPLIIDNIIFEHSMENFDESAGFYNSKGQPVDGITILDNHPILSSFFNAYDMASVMFKDMPAGSHAFKELLDSLPENIKDRIYDDRQLLSKLSDFYQSYMLVANEIVSHEQIGNYIKGFPQYFVKHQIKDKYADNAFIQAIQLVFDKKSGRSYLNIDTTGMLEQEKEKLRMAWTDLHKVNPTLSTRLFTYAFFRGGIGFSPKTWMGLVPIYVKEHLTATRQDGTQTSYVDTYRLFPTDRMVDDIIVEQFVRNNWDNNKLAPRRGGEGTTYDYSHLNEGTLWVHAQKDKDNLQGIMYMKTPIDKKMYLWKRVTPMEDTDSSIEFTRVMPLGNNGEYIEMSLDENMNAMEAVDELKTNDEQAELPQNSPKDAAVDNQDSSPVTPSTSVSQQAKSIAELVPLVMSLHNIKEGAAVDYLKVLKTKALDGTLSKFSKQDIQRIAQENGLKLNVDKALEWFKQLC